MTQSAEARFLEQLRAIVTDPAARGLADDAALLPVERGAIVVTHDVLVAGVHFGFDDPPASIGHRLAAVNLSDLAAKGAVPIGCVLGFALGQDDAWNAAFLDGLRRALDSCRMPLIGGDTVQPPAAAPSQFGMTALGRAGAHTPARSGARDRNALWVTGTIGDAGAGLSIIQRGALEQAPATNASSDSSAPPSAPPSEPPCETSRPRSADTRALIDAYLWPRPRVADGIALAPIVTAMMDVSDGLLIDAQRMAIASQVTITIDLAAVPLSAALVATDTRPNVERRLAAATAGDDYQLLFTLPDGATPPVAATRIGQCQIPRDGDAPGLRLLHADTPVPLPARLGYEHGPTPKQRPHHQDLPLPPFLPIHDSRHV